MTAMFIMPAGMVVTVATLLMPTLVRMESSGRRAVMPVVNHGRGMMVDYRWRRVVIRRAGVIAGGTDADAETIRIPGERSRGKGQCCRQQG